MFDEAAAVEVPEGTPEATPEETDAAMSEGETDISAGAAGLQDVELPGSQEQPAQNDSSASSSDPSEAPERLSACAADLAGATVTVKNQVYTGKALKPAPTVKVGSATLKKGVDYTVSYKNNTKVGTATVIVAGKGSYSGSKSTTFKTAKASVAKATVGKIATQKYTGSARKPSPTVNVGGRTLKKGTDYTLSWKNNVKPGTATLTITGKGSFSGPAKTCSTKRPVGRGPTMCAGCSSR